MQIAVFSDLECPVCKAFHQPLSDLRVRHPTEVSVLFVHFPLTQHRFAMPAATALECAAAQGAQGSMVDRLYEAQDSLGLASWASLASTGGVEDTSEFGRCMAAEARPPRIDAGRTLGSRIGIRGTPTVIINGWMFSNPPFDSLEAYAQRILKDDLWP